MEINKIYQGNSLEVIKSFPDESINTVITSPPYYGLRDYGVADQLGLETYVEDYVQNLVNLFKEVKRVLKKDGTVWLNIGDTYWGGGSGEVQKGHTSTHMSENIKINYHLYKPKDLIGVPWQVAFALQADGWHLRQDIIWHKPNPMPESVTDRCTRSHEYIFLLSKSRVYYFDHESIKEPAKPDKSIRDRDTTKLNNTPGRTKMKGLKSNHYEMKNKRSVWSVSLKPFKDAHFATYPPELIEPCILAGCPEGGVVLDPFMGAGTTAVVAIENKRNYVGIELNPEYIKIAEDRLKPIQAKQETLKHSESVVSKFFN
jgi:DNA modification methylase